MADRAIRRLVALKPCLEIREAQLESVRTEAAATRLSLEEANLRLDEANASVDARLQNFESILGARVFGVQEAVLWRDAVSDATRQVHKVESQVKAIEAQMELARDKLALSDGSARQVRQHVKVAKRKVERARDERILRQNEDIYRQTDGEEK